MKNKKLLGIIGPILGILGFICTWFKDKIDQKQLDDYIDERIQTAIAEHEAKNG